MERQDDYITREVDYQFGLSDLPPHQGMEKYGGLIHNFTGIAQSGYRSNLLGKSTQEIQSAYAVRAEDGKQFFTAMPSISHYGATAFEEEAPIDGQRFGYDEAAQEVRGNATRMAMADTYRRSEAKRGGGPHDYVQLAEDMVSHEDEVEQMRSMYTRLPNQQALYQQQAIRQNGGKEVWNDFDFENEHEGGLAAQHRRMQYAKKEAEEIQMKKRMDRIYADTEGNAMDYWSRDNRITHGGTQRETERAQHDYTWMADQNVQEARSNFGSKMDPIRIELFQSLKTHSLLSSDGRSFIPANLIHKVAEMGATHGEQTQLVEMLEDCFGRTSLNQACSIKELLHFTEEAVQIEANGPEMFRLGGRHRDGGGASAQRAEMVILSKVSQLLLHGGTNGSGRVTKASQDKVDTVRLVAKYNTRVDFLTAQLESGDIPRQKYNQEMYRTLSRFHNDVLETASHHFRREGLNSQSEKLVTLLDNADRIFQLWAATHREFGKNLSLNEVNAMKKFIAFNDDLLLSRALAKGKNTNEGPQGGNVELFMKEYAQELEDCIRISPRFDKLHPGIRAEYKREYTKISQQLDQMAIRSAPKALKESVTALGAVYKEIQDNTRVPQAVKQQVLKQIDMSIGKMDAALLTRQGAGGGRVTLRQAYELRNIADTNARMEKELVEGLGGGTGSRMSRIGIHRSERESGITRARLAHEEQHDDGRALRHRAVRNKTENRGEFGQRMRDSGVSTQDRFRRQTDGVAQNYHNDIGPIGYGSSNRTERFASGSMADTIANAGYSSAY